MKSGNQAAHELLMEYGRKIGKWKRKRFINKWSESGIDLDPARLQDREDHELDRFLRFHLREKEVLSRGMGKRKETGKFY